MQGKQLRSGLLVAVLVVSVCVAFAVGQFPAGEKVYVKIASENLRDAPGGNKIGTVQKGTSLVVLEDSPRWVKVRLDTWVWKESLTGNKLAVDGNVYRALQIIVKDRSAADEILIQLQQGADFATLAKERSIGPSASKGGDLGYFKKGDFQPVVEEVLLGLQPGEVSGIVESDFGFHIFKRLE